MRPNPLFGGNPFGHMHPPRVCVYGGKLILCSDGVHRPEKEAAEFEVQAKKLLEGEQHAGE